MAETVVNAPVGRDTSWLVSAFDGAGAAVAFGDTDTPSCIVWEGSDSPSLVTPSAEWYTDGGAAGAAGGLIKVSLSSTQSAELTPGVYPLETYVTLYGTSTILRVAEAWLQIVASAGSTALPPIYATYADMVAYGGGAWLEAIRQTEGLANFTAERGRARSWLDQLILRKLRPWDRRNFSDAFDNYGPANAENPTLKGYLADGLLIVDDTIKEIVSLKALELACRSRFTFGEGDQLIGRSNYFRARCSATTKNAVAQIDLNADGLPDIAIPLGIVNIR